VIKGVRVFPDHAAPLLERYDLMVAALGYEARCRHAAGELKGRYDHGVAIKFAERNVLAFEANLAWFVDEGFRVAADWIDALSLIDQGDYRTILIDVSSMTRPLMAELVRWLSTDRRSYRVDFLYSPALYAPPSQGTAPQTYSGPVTPAYAGWSNTPDLPLSAVIGVGHEAGRALGVLEYLEPAVAWIFIPSSSDQPDHQLPYDEAIRKINGDLYSVIPDEQYVGYDVSNPFQCFEALESIVYGLKGRSRPVIAPFGPKLFALVSILVAESFYPDVTVWRVSGGQFDVPIDHQPMGPVYRLPVEFSSVD
jgi:hypothetical protein